VVFRSIPLAPECPHCGQALPILPWDFESLTFVDTREVEGVGVEASCGSCLEKGIVPLSEVRPALRLGLAVVAVIVLAVGYGQVPVISLILAFSFGFYGFVKNRMGPGVKSIDSLTLETMWLSPLAIGVLVWLYLAGDITLGTISTTHTLLLLLAGAVTSIPLLLFGAAIRRLPLSIIGLMQYIAPVLQFLFGVVVMSVWCPSAAGVARQSKIACPRK
jgi:hypothetical protein